MAQPPVYDRSYSFHDYQAENPRAPLPADKLDEEFARVKTTLDGILQNLAIIQRDDTALANNSVGYDQLRDEVDLGFNPPVDWASGTNYITRDTVFHDVQMYRCVVSHISSNTFSDDLNAGYWELIIDFASVQSAAIAARDEAQDAQAAAEDARDIALQAQADAESARDVATGAKNDAELAQAAAESARDDAILAKVAAESAQSDAEAAQAAAEGARDDAILAKNAAEGFKDDAEAAYLAASGVQTAVFNARDAALQAQSDAEDARDVAIQEAGDAESAKDTAVQAKNDAALAQSAAESARDDAIQAKSDAESAKGDAEAAQLAAESARDDAILAKNAAEGFKNDAQSAAQDAIDALEDMEEKYLGAHATAPAGAFAGQMYFNTVTNLMYVYDGANWGLMSSGGDMLTGVYDPQSKGADAFDMDNMAEGSVNLILTQSERNAIADSYEKSFRHFDTRADVTGQAIPSSVNFIVTRGYSTIGDGGGAVYKRVGSQPAHEGKVQSNDGAWWEIIGPEISQKQINGTLKQLIEAAGTRPAILDEGTVTVDALVGFSGTDGVTLRGRSTKTSILSRGNSLNSVVSFNNSDGVKLEDFTLNMRFSTTGNEGHGIIFVDSTDVYLRGVLVSDLGNNGGSAGSGIISYMGAEIPQRNRIVDSTVIGDVSLSDNTNGFLLVDTRFSQMRGNVAHGIAAFAHEYKNDARYNTGSDLIAVSSAYGLGFGQTTTGTDGVDYTVCTNIVAAQCDVGFVLGEGSYNAINNMVVNTNNSPEKLNSKHGVRISGGATGNLVTDVVSVGAGNESSVRIDDSNNNVVHIAAFDASTNTVTFTGTAAGNFVEVMHTGTRDHIALSIADSTGKAINGMDANIVYSPTTGERLGSRSGYFKDSLVRGATLAYNSVQTWRHEHPSSVIFAGAMPSDTAQYFGLQCNVGSTANVASILYDVGNARWTIGSSSTVVGILNTSLWSPGADNARALGTGGARFSQVYAATGTINTSDAREKDWRGELNAAEIAVAKRISKLVGIYRWHHAIAAKGDGARLHAGVRAQDVIAAFEAEGLDPYKYGVVCYDEWEADPEAGLEEAGDRYGVRYDELWAFVAAGFEARLAALEDAE